MHHLANSMTKLCHGREQDSAGWEGDPMYNCSGEETVFIIVGRGGDLFVCQRVDEFRTQISYGDFLGWENKILFKWSRSHDQDCHHAHIW